MCVGGGACGGYLLVKAKTAITYCGTPESYFRCCIMVQYEFSVFAVLSLQRKYCVPSGRALPLSAFAAWLPLFKVPAHVALVTYTGVLLGSSSGLVPDLNSERTLTSNNSLWSYIFNV